MGKPLTAEQKRMVLNAIVAERDRYRVALDRIYGHTDPNVIPGTPAPDPRWIRLVAEAALYPK